MVVAILTLHIYSCIFYLSAALYDFSPETWVVRLGLQDADPYTLYMNSLDWCL